MLGAGILARNAVQRGLKVKPWVKTSLAPGSKVVTEYLDRAGLTEYLEALGFHLVGYGCTTCIGNSGPLPEEVSKVVNDSDLAVVSVLSGNRNFEGRINPDVKMNYLGSPPLCVAYALAGTMDIDLYDEPLGEDDHGQPVFLKDIWPSEAEVAKTVEEAVRSDMFRKSYAEVFDGDERWNSLQIPTGDSFHWDEQSTYVRRPPFFEALAGAARARDRHRGGAGARGARRQRHDRPHLAGGLDQARRPRGSVPDRPRRAAEGLQLLRLSARQPRGDDARHLREHPPAQPARTGNGGRRHPPRA
jgi:aconitase A